MSALVPNLSGEAEMDCEDPDAIAVALGFRRLVSGRGVGTGYRIDLKYGTMCAR